MTGSEPTAPDTAVDLAARNRGAAILAIRPLLRHAAVASTFGSQNFPGTSPPIDDAMEVMRKDIDKVSDGDLRAVSNMLAAQAMTLDTLFTEMARRAGANMGEYTDAAERYMRLALKAQTNSRTTLEALARMHQPREQTVKHVHVNQGGQAVVADNFHTHTGAPDYGKTADQPHEQSARSASLPCPDQGGDTVPVASFEGQDALQPSWRA